MGTEEGWLKKQKASSTQATTILLTAHLIVQIGVIGVVAVITKDNSNITDDQHYYAPGTTTIDILHNEQCV